MKTQNVKTKYIKRHEDAPAVHVAGPHPTATATATAPTTAAAPGSFVGGRPCCGSIVKSRQRLLTGTLCHTSQQPPSLGGYNPSYKARSLKTRGLRHVI